MGRGWGGGGVELNVRYTFLTLHCVTRAFVISATGLVVLLVAVIHVSYAVSLDEEM